MIPGLGRSPGEGKGYPLQYSGLENSMDSIGSDYRGHQESDVPIPLLTNYIKKQIINQDRFVYIKIWGDNMILKD